MVVEYSLSNAGPGLLSILILSIVIAGFVIYDHYNPED